MDFLEPFLLFGNPDPGFDAKDDLEMAAAMIAGNRAIAADFSNQGHPQETLEVLAELGVDVDEYIECVVDNVEFVMQQGMLPDGSQSRLSLPS